MPKIKVSSHKTLLVLKSKLSRGEKINDRELEFLNRHYICGLFKISYDGKKTIQYTAPLSVPLNKYLADRVLNETQFWRLIAQIVEIVRTVELNGLYQGHLILAEQAVFVNEITRELYFIYQPVDSPRMEANALALLHSITYGEKKKDKTGANQFLIKFEQFLEQHYHMEQIHSYIEQVFPQIYAMVRKADSGKSGFITTNPLEYSRHYEQKQVEEEPGTVLLMEEEEGTMLLTKEEGTTLLTRERRLVLIRQGNKQRITVSGTVFTLGKSTQNDYCIEGNTAISRKHAEIKKRGKDHYLSDLHSTNGTRLNGVVLADGEEVLLKDGDKLLLGDEEFRAEVD